MLVYHFANSLVCAPEICIVEIKNDKEMCELLCTVIITVNKGNIVYIMHDVSHEILLLDTVYDFLSCSRHILIKQ